MDDYTPNSGTGFDAQFVTGPYAGLHGTVVRQKNGGLRFVLNVQFTQQPDGVVDLDSADLSEIPQASDTQAVIPRAFDRWPRFWKLMGFAFPKGVRDRIYDPAVSELMTDYAARKQFRTKAARRWLTFCFTFRTALLVLDCVRALVMDRAIQFLLPLMPEWVRRWWTLS